MIRKNVTFFDCADLKQVSILNMHILHRWRAGKPRPYGFDTY